MVSHEAKKLGTNSTRFRRIGREGVDGEQRHHTGRPEEDPGDHSDQSARSTADAMATRPAETGGAALALARRRGQTGSALQSGPACEERKGSRGASFGARCLLPVHRDTDDAHACRADGGPRHVDHARRVLVRGHAAPHRRPGASGAAVPQAGGRGAVAPASPGVGRRHGLRGRPPHQAHRRAVARHPARAVGRRRPHRERATRAQQAALGGLDRRRSRARPRRARGQGPPLVDGRRVGRGAVARLLRSRGRPGRHR